MCGWLFDRADDCKNFKGRFRVTAPVVSKALRILSHIAGSRYVHNIGTSGTFTFSIDRAIYDMISLLLLLYLRLGRLVLGIAGVENSDKVLGHDRDTAVYICPGYLT